jgi:5'/3'-nucleotidase
MKPHILVTNDDGIDSPGLLALKQALTGVGQVSVIAPDHNWSAAGHSKTMHKPLRINKVHLSDGDHAYSTDGAPSDCVAIAVLGFLQQKVDLVVSGINKGSNMGDDITYSGTVAAAMEGIIWGIPSLAVSLDGYVAEEPEMNNFALAARVAACLADQILRDGLPPETLLNVNVPNAEERTITGLEITRLGKRGYQDELIVRTDPFGRHYYWIGGGKPTLINEPGTDIRAIADSKISVTPIHLDLTNHALIPKLQQWKLEWRCNTV